MINLKLKSFNPCSVGQLIQSYRNSFRHAEFVWFQSLFCWTINSKGTVRFILCLSTRRFNPCSVGQLIQSRYYDPQKERWQCFNPCSVGQLIQSFAMCIAYDVANKFQSLFCWTINSKISSTRMGERWHDRFNPCSVGQLIQSFGLSLLCFMAILFQSLFCWTINSKNINNFILFHFASVSILVLLDN